jgi:hypothetical protein
MSAGTTAIADVIVPEIFGPYVQQLTQQKSRLIRSGAIVMDAALNQFLAGGGLTIHAPSWKDLDDDDDLVSSDTGGASSPNKIGSADEIAIRLSRNNSWAAADLASALAGEDPMDAIAGRVSDYWVRRFQAIYVSTLLGVFADNAAAPDATEHTTNDLTFDASGGGFVDGVTNFSAEAFIDATLTMGDSMDSLGMVCMHSVVYAKALKNNLIDFITDSDNGAAIRIATFLGREVIIDDAMPNAAGVFQTWLFGAGAVRMGIGMPKVAVEVIRVPGANNGGGSETLHNRHELCMHPVGHKYVGGATKGGPSNAATSGNLAHAASWARVYSERKQIKIARLLTREF